ncbi:MAG: hypothetical protein ACO1TE_01645 [Prosthecobacter sp.]
MYAARVKNGFVPRTRADIDPLLKKSETSTCPFANLPVTKNQRWGEPLTAEKMLECRWVKPILVCQVAFVAMQDDKPARRVVRESLRQS